MNMPCRGEGVAPCVPRQHKVAMLLLMIGVCAGCADRDMSDVHNFVAETKRTTPIKKPDPPPEIKPYQPFPYTAEGLKDPFTVSPFAREEELIMPEDVAMEASKGYSGVRPDPNRVREELEKVVPINPI